MTISANEKYLLNKMNSVAQQVQLGTLIENAETIVASEIPLVDGKVLVGNASNVAAGVTPSGDVTISNAGVTAIGAKKVLASMIATADGKVLIGGAGGAAAEQTLSGDVTVSNAGVTAIGAAKVTEAMLQSADSRALLAARVAHAEFDPSANAGERTQAAHTISVTLPDNAIMIRSWYDVITTFTSATDAATIAIHAEAANDIVTATAISAGGSIWDAGLHAGAQDGGPSNMVKLTAARTLTVTVAGGEDLTAGKLHLFVEYVVSV